jgi:hypothetical protein
MVKGPKGDPNGRTDSLRGKIHFPNARDGAEVMLYIISAKISKILRQLVSCFTSILVLNTFLTYISIQVC